MCVTEGVVGAELAPWDENTEKIRGLNDCGASVFASELLCTNYICDKHTNEEYCSRRLASHE